MLVVLSTAVCLVAACRLHAAQGTHLRASHAASVISADTPRLLFVDDGEVRVSLQLQNAGTEVWDQAAGFQVSYHWLTDGLFTPRSRVVLDGARTELAATVRPGETVRVDARLAPPPRAGLYALQWDPVQEKVAWFSDRDPAPPSPVLIVVLPPLAALATPLPVVAAALFWLALWLKRRGGGPLLAALWCAFCLFAAQVAVLAETRPHTGGLALEWSALAAIACPLLVVTLVGHWMRSWLLWLVALAGSLVALADLVYFRYFGDVISTSVLAAAGEGSNVGESVASLLGRRDVWIVVNVLAALPLVWESARGDAASARAPQRWRGLILRSAAAVVVALLLLRFSGAAGAVQRGYSNLTVVDALGPFGYHAYDTTGYMRDRWHRPPLDPAARQEVRDWFAGRAPLRAGVGPLYGAARQKNLIVVQVESLQGFVVGLKINGQEVTPNLNRMRGEGLSFSNVWDQSNEGRTSDAEFLALASLLPLEHGAVAHQYAGNHFVALPRVLADHGYSTLSAVPFRVEFWNRRAMHRAYGFSRSLFIDAFEPGEVIGWGLNDRAFLQQMIPKLQALPRPFMAWMITLSLHHPYASFPDEHKVLDVGEWTGSAFGNYLHAMHFLDQAIGDLRDGLVRAGLANDTVVMVFGDHDAGLAWDASVARAIGAPVAERDWQVHDRVPWVMAIPGSGAPRGEIATHAGQIDMAPTLLALLGVDPAPLPYMGRNLLGRASNGLRVRPYGAWAGDALFFEPAGRLPERCYALTAGVDVSADRCRDGTADSAWRREISRRVLAYDLQASLIN